MSVPYNAVTQQQHYFPMYSLQKFYADVRDATPLADYTGDIVMSPKLDGAAVEHLYIDGVYARSLTRGDGIEGRDVTDKFQATNLIPKTIPQLGVVQITGELCASKAWEHARNYAAGALNLGSVEEFKTRGVEFFAYCIQPSLSPWFDVDMRTMQKWGFCTVQDKNLM